MAAAAAASEDAHAVEIIRIDPAAGLVVDEDALKAILMHPDVQDLPVAVVCVAGKYREGKSFLLNYFLNYLSAEEGSKTEWWKMYPGDGSGFKWQSGVGRVTTGISFWSKPFIRTVEGKKAAVLLVDTQGTFDNESTMAENVRVFSLGALLSSFLINNVKEKISEDLLQQLQLFVEFGKTTKDKGQGGLQTTCFLVRDWRNESQFPLGRVGGEQYVNDVLDSPKREELSRVRAYIRQSFESIHGFLLPSPGDDFLEQCDKGVYDLSKLRAKFVDNVRDLVTWVISSLKIKRVANTAVRCRDLCLLTIQCRNVFNSSEQPRVEGLFEAMARVNHLTVKLTALKSYVEKMDALMSAGTYIKPAELDKANQEERHRAVSLFVETQKLGAEDFSELFLTELKKDMDKKFKEVQELNTARRSAKLTTPALLFAASMLCNILGSVLGLMGLSPLVGLLSSLMWLCVLALLVWFYCNVTGEFRDIQEQLDGAVDALFPQASLLMTRVAPHLGGLAAVALAKKKN